MSSLFQDMEEKPQENVQTAWKTYNYHRIPAVKAFENIKWFWNWERDIFVVEIIWLFSRIILIWLYTCGIYNYCEIFGSIYKKIEMSKVSKKMEEVLVNFSSSIMMHQYLYFFLQIYLASCTSL